jgi:predicted anti-sigma-YlaC factor YlaD
MEPLSPIECERTRKQLSLRLDGALSEVGAARVRSHLASCPTCRRFAAEVTATTQLLRETPLEQPVFPIVTLPRRRPAVRGFQVAAAAAAVVATIGLSAVLGTVRRERAAVSPPTTGARALALRSPEDEVRLLRRSQPHVSPHGQLVR